MDDTTRLVSELLGKLKELNYRVCNYRHDLAEEFQRHSRHLLHNVPEHISARVEQVIAEELRNYPALSPDFVPHTAHVDLGRSAASRSAPTGRVSPPPVLPHSSAVSSSPSDHGRDSEFHGLFTPSYLPLLEVVQPSRAMSSSIAASSSETPRNTQSDDIPDTLRHAHLDTTPPLPDPIPSHPELTSPISPTSEERCFNRRRSALRRSSSGSARGIQSPRRVRFDVEGEEVLPTTSPPTPAQVHALPTSPPPEPQTMPIHQPISHIIFDGEASILGDSPPRPKKISSTERLRALARSSTEDVSKWTVVGDLQDDEDDDEEGLIMFSSKSNSKARTPELATPTSLENSTNSHSVLDGSSRNEARQINDDQTIDRDEAADEIHELPSPATFRSEARFSTHEAMRNVEQTADSRLEPALPIIPEAPGRTTTIGPDEFSSFEEVVFGFDDEWASPQETGPEYFEEDLSVEGIVVRDSEGLPDVPSVASPGIAIAKPASPPPTSPAPSVSKYPGASGSYKGKPFIIGVVRNEELYKKAAEMGDVGMFVGSVDGRTGVDPSDSYLLDGTPGSLGKRLLEEAHSRRMKRNAEKPEK
ncbi:hypothetical protein F4861DRAFT_523496 [Xylaria intraflava]|nr:hypothetical protein F4861DRAFT_523496 [Xylaria intraflava]